MAYLENYDTRQLRNVLGTFTTGVTVVTTRDAQRRLHGVTANSFSSVSLEPPLILWSQALTSKSLPAFSEAKHFAVNILADDQIALSNHFAKSSEDKFAAIAYQQGIDGVPVLEGTVAHFECERVAAYPAGDHVIYIGEVKRVAHSGRRPLAFAHGRYMVPYAHELGPLALHRREAPAPTAEAIRIATDLLPSLQAQVAPFACALAVWGSHGPTIIRVQPDSSAETDHFAAGQVLSLTRTATGRAFAAFLPAAITKPFVEEDLRLSRVADEDETAQRTLFEAGLARACESGFATALGLDGASATEIAQDSCSAPVHNAAGEMVLAITLGRTGGATLDERVSNELLAAARELSATLSGAKRREGLDPAQP